ANAIALVAVEQESGKLRGLPEADRQQAGRDRIEAAGMARLPRVVEPLHALKHRVRGEPLRLVEQQGAVDVATRRATRGAHASVLVAIRCELAILLERVVQQAIDLVGLAYAVVGLERELGDVADLEAPPELPSQLAL